MCTTHTKEPGSFVQRHLCHLCLLRAHQPYLLKCHTGFEHGAYWQCVTCLNPLVISSIVDLSAKPEFKSYMRSAAPTLKGIEK